MTFGFAYPWMLLLLLPLVGFLWWAGRRKPRALSLPRAGSMALMRSTGVSALARVPDLLRALTLALLIVALARPQIAAGVVEDSTEGVPIVIAIDISSSMLAEDFGTLNRLQVARQQVATFIRGRSADPIGLVAFAGEAITQVPITTDYRVLFSALNNLEVGLVEDGTAIGMGLATAATRLQGIPAESRVIILMSDGENNRGEIEPLTAARAAAELGIQIFTIGVGSDEPAPVPLRRRADGGFQYAELPVGLDEALLREIAEIGGGEYFRATNPQALTAIYQQLDELVRTPLRTRRYIEYIELYLVFVLVACGTLPGEWMLRASRWGRLP